MRDQGPARNLVSVDLIGVAVGVGAPDPRCSTGPDALRQRGLLDALRAGAAKPVAWTETICVEHQGDAVDTVHAACTQLARHVAQAVADDRLPIVLGGDHSCAIGTWKGAVRARGAIGLLWIDAHLDAHVPETSPTGQLHGMPLAVLLGHGNRSLVDIADGARLLPQHVCVIGVRSYEDEEATFLERLGVRVFPMAEVATRGFDAVMQEALAIVGNGTAGFGVTLDLDALDPRDAPGVGTPVLGGLNANDVAGALARLHAHPSLVAVEIVEYNPERDRQGATADLVVRLLRAALNGDAGRCADDLIALEETYGAHHYEPLPVVLVRGSGVYVWDEHGRRYLDMMSAYSAVSFGHGHPRLLSALTTQAQRLAVTSRAYYNDRLPLLLQRLCEITGLDLALPANTGVEAVEAAIKVARKWAYEVKGVAPEHAEIIACTGNFHGRTIAAVGMSSEAQYRQGFGPFAPGFVRIPFGEVQALRDAITPETAAFIVEPVQGEAGIKVPPPGYLARCAEVCRERNVLLICDEVQTGLGRTGRLFACEHDAVLPDGIILGKALGGGLLPVSAFVGRREVMAVLKPGDHGSTFGGNPLAAAVALAAIDLLQDEALPQRAAALGEHLLRGLQSIDSPLVREVRGKGLLTGLELDTRWVDARTACVKLLEHGVLSKDTHHTVLRFAPAFVITEDEIDMAVDALRATLAELERAVPTAA